MLKKIYLELVVIRKELQAFRSYLEPNVAKEEQLYRRVREPYSNNYTYIPVK